MEQKFSKPFHSRTNDFATIDSPFMWEREKEKERRSTDMTSTVLIVAEQQQLRLGEIHQHLIN